jgi:cytochrome c oxidase cbb3-type subunit IV
MDLNQIRSIVTLLAFIVFVAIVVRVWRGANRDRHAEAAALPFADEPGQSQGQKSS